MTAPALVFSDEQAEAHDRIAESLRGLGVDIDRRHDHAHGGGQVPTCWR
jgi:exodeoxyribonuclease-5